VICLKVKASFFFGVIQDDAARKEGALPSVFSLKVQQSGVAGERYSDARKEIAMSLCEQHSHWFCPLQAARHSEFVGTKKDSSKQIHTKIAETFDGLMEVVIFITLQKTPKNNTMRLSGLTPPSRFIS
jgi:hypothetical protein